MYYLYLSICPWQVNTQMGPLRGVPNFLGIMFNKIPFDAEVDARFYMILENYPNANRPNGLFTSNEVLNIEFSRPSSCNLLKSNFSIARPISEASTCEAPSFFLNSANLITRTNSTGLKSLQLYKDMCRKMSLGLLKCIR